jgi:hypothetical protein
VIRYYVRCATCAVEYELTREIIHGPFPLEDGGVLREAVCPRDKTMMWRQVDYPDVEPEIHRRVQ